VKAFGSGATLKLFDGLAGLTGLVAPGLAQILLIAAAGFVIC